MTALHRTVAARGGLGPPPPRRPRRDRTYRGWRAAAARRVSAADAVVFAGVLVLLYVAVRIGRGVAAPIPAGAPTRADTSVRHVPYDAARSLLRLFAALAASYAFTLAYGSTAARSRRAERVLIPLLDILQSVPILGFLSITVTAFIALAPGSYVGLELASVFAIFTSQAWNLAFSFYHSLITQPRELDEAARLLGLSRWRRFWKLDVPSGAIGLVWNGMMSTGGGWFFLVASEAISVLNHQYSLPGIGSYVGAAIDEGDLGKVGIGVLAMIVLVVAVNVVFWRPLVAWSERFKNEQSEAQEAPRSLVLDLLRRTRGLRIVGRTRRRLADPVNGLGDRVFGVERAGPVDARARRRGDLVFAVVIGGVIGCGLTRLLGYVTEDQGWRVFASPAADGLVTLARVVVVVAVSTVVWVPVGAKIGLDPKASRLAQPIVQVLASFPANFLFPFAVWFMVRTGFTVQLGGIALMALGAQWYILFNAIAGAQAIPSDLREAMDDLHVTGWLRWRRLVLPAVFPAYVTGGITASGGAWNASIVAEIVTYGGTTLTATGLGATIAHATEVGDFHQILAGVTVMALYIIALNRLVWHRLSRLAERRYRLT